ncbi:response regulator transcription factor [Nocardiopsis flavescens]|uniref:DNA-binding response regulator, OmpR family, contains REC and winged-helix (WHTH) domain n=1 Tax=Nocardiopsis flavescens TaxID=758803 RepID=A0A1M6CB10_9ACTN|nr:response regulator transcription factor [Nocardiopsis flavescens]SHI58220.1 DNA-binding response regulator, OmpR family, contains REC and winged-helix (wHTH) domain [Nocardiopsis flavescens]
MAILVVEDEEGIVSFVRRGLESAGHRVLVASDGVDGLAMALSDDVELVVLDLGLPGIPGEEVLRRLRRRRPSVPVIVLTAKDGVSDRVANLDAGADDYMVKPFSVSELLARVRARLRTGGQERGDVLAAGGIELDLGARTASVAGATVTLSAREFALLEVLVRHPGQVFSQPQLLDRVWGYDFDGASNVVEVYVSQLRRKLGARRIVTVRGVGYRLDDGGGR